jgi:hypothetical protein
MTEDRAAWLRALVDEAQALPVERRLAFVDEACAGDQALRAVLVAALSDGAATVVVETRVVGPAGAPPPRPVAEGDDTEEQLASGTRLGSWEIVHRIGQGGMGEVYLARRADRAFELQVAIKLLKRGLDTVAVVRRFLAERRILAQLTHPNIAHAMDAGATPDGRPYLVMEYVDGRSITDHAAASRLSVPERLRLLITVCLAVQEAHRRQIVHRDLKPSNVMVTGEGQVKLLDFGIARSLAEDAGDATRMAGEGNALTPAYAAPEQIRGEAITPTADVYALGVILYELLTGRLPHLREGGSISAMAAALERETLVRPSAALQLERGWLAESERAARLGAVSRDLDVISVKALHPESLRRYGTALELADDLQRLLDQRPVLARGDSLAYRASRFVRRNRLVVAATAAVLLALSGGLSVALWQAGVARDEARNALLAQRRAEQVKAFTLSIFGEQDPYERTRAQQRTPLQLIDEAAQRVDSELAGDSEIQSEVLLELAAIRVKLGDYAGARTMIERALVTQKQLGGPDSLPMARGLIELARAAVAEKGDAAPEIEPNVREALRILNLRGGADRQELATAKLLLGRALGFLQATTDEALKLLVEARRLLDAPGGDGRGAIDVRLAEMSVLNRAKRFDEAEAAAREAIARIEARYGPDSLKLGYPLELLGSLLMEARSRPADAIPLLERSIAIRHKAWPDGDAKLALSYSRLGEAYAAVNRYADAQVAFEEGERAIPDGDDGNRFLYLFRRLLFEQQAERWVAAEADARVVFALSRKLYGDAVPYTWQAAAIRGHALASLGRHAEAEAILLEARERMRAAVGVDAYENEQPATLLGIARLFAGRPQDALEPLRSALRLTESALSRDSTQWADAAINVAEALMLLGESEAGEATALVDAAIANYTAANDPIGLAKALIDRGMLRQRRGERGAGDADLDRAEALLRADGGSYDIDLRRIAIARAAPDPLRRPRK